MTCCHTNTKPPFSRNDIARIVLAFPLYFFGLDLIHYQIFSAHNTLYAAYPIYYLTIAAYKIAWGLFVYYCCFSGAAAKGFFVPLFRNVRRQNVVIFGLLFAALAVQFFQQGGFETYHGNDANRQIGQFPAMFVLLTQTLNKFIGAALESIFLFLPLLAIRQAAIDKWGAFGWLGILGVFYVMFVLSHPERLQYVSLYSSALWLFITLYAAVAQRSIWFPILWHFVWNIFIFVSTVVPDYEFSVRYVVIMSVLLLLLLVVPIYCYVTARKSKYYR